MCDSITKFNRLIYSYLLLYNLPVNLMYKLEPIQRRAIHVLYKLNYICFNVITRLVYVDIGYCALHIMLYTWDSLNI